MKERTLFNPLTLSHCGFWTDNDFSQLTLFAIEGRSPIAMTSNMRAGKKGANPYSTVTALIMACNLEGGGGLYALKTVYVCLTSCVCVCVYVCVLVCVCVLA